MTAPQAEIQDRLARATSYLESLWHGDEARYTAGGLPNPLSTCFSVMALETLGQTASWSEKRKQAIGQQLQTYQNPESGLFELPSLRVEDLKYPQLCDKPYLNLQFTYFALSALHVIGLRAKHPLTFAHGFSNRHYANGWIDAGPWNNPWNQSNRVMFLLRFLIYLSDHEASDEALATFDSILDYLDDRQSPRTGLWHGSHDCGDREAVYAGYHFFPFYAWRNREIAYAEKILNTTLSIQNDDGLFGFERGGGACEDLDAIDVLALLVREQPEFSDQVRDALSASLGAILALQRPDGGFPNYLDNPIPLLRIYKPANMLRFARESFDLLRTAHKFRRVPPVRQRPYYYSGWKMLEGVKGQSDVWGTWFRLLAIVTILKRLPELGQLPSGCRFHELPALGWHPKDQ
jgi:hypothetical protein